MLLKFKILYHRTFSNPEFILWFENSKLEKVYGNVKSGFKRDCIEFIKNHKIQNGLIIGDKKSSGRIYLIFSKEIPQQLHQQLRNIWGTY